MKATTHFHERLVLCVQCGAPLAVEPTARAARCAHCAAENVVGLRLADPVGGAWGAGEVARVEALRAQSRALVLDPRVAPLACEGRLLPDHELEAFGWWQRMRADVGARPELEGALVDLTLLLAARSAERRDLERERGLVESAFGAARSGRGRQLLAAAMVDWSVRAGDAGAATSWLALCQPRPSDLVMDGAYRHAQAVLSTASGDFRGVVRVLGGSPADLPVAERFAGALDVLRANAWEKLGRAPTAVDRLVYLEIESSPFVAQQARLFARTHPSLRLAEATWPEARAQASRVLAATHARAGMGLVIVLTMAGYFVLFPVLYALVAPFGIGSLLNFALWIPGLFLLSLGVAKVAVVRRTTQVGFRGVLAPARVLRATFTDQATANHDAGAAVLSELALLVCPDDGPPFEAGETFVTTPERAARTPLGSAHHVRFLGREVSLQLPL